MFGYHTKSVVDKKGIYFMNSLMFMTQHNEKQVLNLLIQKISNFILFLIINI